MCVWGFFLIIGLDKGEASEFGISRPRPLLAERPWASL